MTAAPSDEKVEPVKTDDAKGKLANIFGKLKDIKLKKPSFANNLTNNDPNYLNFICINILGVLGSGLAFWVFNLLIKETSSVFASSVTYLIPIVAIFWGVIDGEDFGIVQFYLCLVIFCGIYLIKSKN